MCRYPERASGFPRQGWQRKSLLRGIRSPNGALNLSNPAGFDRFHTTVKATAAQQDCSVQPGSRPNRSVINPAMKGSFPVLYLCSRFAGMILQIPDSRF
jgi:hypothetical protein